MTYLRIEVNSMLVPIFTVLLWGSVVCLVLKNIYKTTVKVWRSNNGRI